MTTHGKTLLLHGCMSIAFLAITGSASAQEAAMRAVEHKNFQLQVPANWESFDSETADGGLTQIFYDPDLKTSSRQCVLESSMQPLNAAELDSPSLKTAWRQKKWSEVLPHIADARDVVMKESSYSRNANGQGQHVGEFTFYASQFFWHSRSYIMHTADRLINLTCSASSHNSPLDADTAFQQMNPTIGRIANSVRQLP